ncbi:MAG: hypothetical protein KF850_25500 [Labilithrix sp.]|nr:hypothetical protein [Labilithrix sp.]MBX3215418.1 hypothetical protein [Labilithrix sp.]
MLGRVAELLDSGFVPAAHVVAEATVSRTAEGAFHLELQTRAGELVDVRTLDAVTCGSLAKAAAVVIAVALSSAKPEQTEDVSVGAPPVRNAPRSGAQPRDPRLSRAELPATKPPTVSWRAGAAGATNAGTLPNAIAGVALTTSLDIEWLRLGALGALYVPRHVTFSVPVESTLRFDVRTLSAYACALFRWRRAQVGPCAEAGGMFVHVEGVGLSNARAADITMPTAAGGAVLNVELSSRVRAFFYPNVTSPLVAQPVGVRTSRGDVTLNDLSSPSFRGLLGVDVRLW